MKSTASNPGLSIRESDRDFLRFLWVDNLDKLEPAVVQFRFCRLPFGLKPSPSILGATLNKHASLFENTEPHIAKIIKGMYADDLSCGAGSANAVLEIMHKSKGPFTLCNLYKTRNINVCQCLQMHSMTNLAVVNISYLKFSSNACGIMDSDRECAAAAAIAIAVICKKRKRWLKTM